MNQLKLIPVSNVLPLRVTRVLRGEANCQREAKKNDQLSGATQPPLPLTPQRLELIKAYGKPPLRDAEKAATPIPRPFAPRAQAALPARDHRLGDTPLTPLRLALSSGIRRLVAGLILVAVLQILTLGAIFWLGAINTPWSRPVALPSDKNPVPEAQFAIPAPVLSAPTTLEASAGENVPFPVALDGTDGVPARSIISISGLPQGSTFSSGRPYGGTEWNFKTDEIGDLYLAVPSTAGSEAKLIIQLVAPNGGVLAATTTILNVTAGPEAMRAGPEANIPVHAVKTQLIQGQPGDQSSQELNAMDAGQRSVNLESRKAPSEDTVQLPTKHQAPTASDGVDTGWIKPSASVNLRKGPKSSAPVVGVVAKGAKLRVISRKRGWVQVTNPATSQQGWIYAGVVDTIR
jgi:hypothetical protein